MKKTFITLFIILVAFKVNAQSDTSANKIYLSVDKDPEFPGGITEFYRFIGKTMNYPVKSVMKGETGRVVVSFIIEKDGSVGSAKVLVPATASLDAEAIRVVNLSPKWNPGSVGDTPVRTQFTLPVTFRLPKVSGTINSLPNMLFSQ